MQCDYMELPHWTAGVRTDVKARAPVATPSAHKNLSRNRKTMARELYALFNHSVFGDKVCVCVRVCKNHCFKKWDTGMIEAAREV